MNKKQFRNHLSVQQNLAVQKAKELDYLKAMNDQLLVELEYRNLLLFDLIPTTMQDEQVLLDFIKAEKELGANEEELEVKTYKTHTTGDKPKEFKYLKKHWQMLIEQGPTKIREHLNKLAEQLKKD